MRYFEIKYYLRPSRADSRVSSSAYSSSPPTGIPFARWVIFIFLDGKVSFIIFSTKTAVVFPSGVGFKAIIISEKYCFLLFFLIPQFLTGLYLLFSS